MLALRRTRTLLGPRGVEGLQDPRVTGDRIQLWHHQGADHRTDVQAKPLFWWELPGFDYHDWSRSKADYNVRHGFSATSALSLNLRPAARIRFRGKFKGWGLRAIGWAIFLCSISWIWNINLSKRAWIDTSDEMVRIHPRVSSPTRLSRVPCRFLLSHRTPEALVLPGA